MSKKNEELKAARKAIAELGEAVRRSQKNQSTKRDTAERVGSDGSASSVESNSSPDVASLAQKRKKKNVCTLRYIRKIREK